MSSTSKSKSQSESTSKSQSKSKSKSQSKSKSYGRKGKFIPKPKQRWQVKQPKRNWLELPSDLMVNILQRLGVVDILENVQKVCTAWREICKDPSMWRRINIDRFSDPRGKLVFREMCKHAVDRSQGQLLDLTMVGFCNYELLQYVSDRSSQLRRLEIISCSYEMYASWSNHLKKLPLLEELSLVRTKISPHDIEAAGSFCPLLKILKLNQKAIRSWDYDDDDDFDGASWAMENAITLAVGKNLPGLTHLELIGNIMSNTGLEAILDGCCRLESLDIRRCMCVDLKGELGKRCSQQIKFLKLPNDSFEGCPHAAYVLDDDSYDFDTDGYSYSDYDDEFDDEYYDYDDYTAYDNEDELSEMMAFMYMFG